MVVVIVKFPWGILFGSAIVDDRAVGAVEAGSEIALALQAHRR